METLTKDKIQICLDGMPQEFSIDELMDRLVLLSKIDNGLIQVEQGQTISHETMKMKYQQWRQG